MRDYLYGLYRKGLEDDLCGPWSLKGLMCTRGMRVYSLPDARDFVLVFGVCAHPEVGLLIAEHLARGIGRGREFEWSCQQL